MASNDDELTNISIVKTEIIRGEQDSLLEEYPRSESGEIREKTRSKILTSKTLKHRVPRATTKSTSIRIRELARPTKQRVLLTLNEKASILSPVFVDNLIRIIETESCLTPEEAAQVYHRKKCKTKKTTRLSAPFARKLMDQIMKDIAHATTLHRDATMCQYLLARRFVKSILEYRCEIQNKYVREIVDVILKRLTSLDEYAYAPNGDRTTQQLRLLADLVACWIAEILVEVAQTRKETLKEYCKERQMRMMEVERERDNDNQTNKRNRRLEADGSEEGE